MSARRTIFLACPYGQVGGGMGSIMAYLAAMNEDPFGRFDIILSAKSDILTEK